MANHYFSRMRNKMIKSSHPIIGISLGILAVICFSFTLPITRYLFSLDLAILDIALGRSLFGALFSVSILMVTKQKLPSKKQIPRLLLISVSAAFGFSLLTTYGTQTVPASHGGVILAGNGISAALFGCLLSSERPSWQFWATSLTGFLLIALFSYITHGGANFLGVYYGEIALIFAVLMAGISHAQGAVLAKEMGGWQVICWAMTFALPILLPLSFISMDFEKIAMMDLWGWSNLLFLGIVNTCFVFVIWYHAMLLGGIAKIAQLQLLQPFFTFVAAVLLLNEPLEPLVIIFSVLIVGVVMISQYTRVHHRV